ncbi:MAG: GNAT family N-acetyltransferase [Richelia sp. RM2_1_2]|uniref:GNAT family N-acetyltransferase n=1 Tax=Plectonema cf. radiosum LEGE 06105 TaxID=945769 RepID=A0A8J7FAW8_9CYAN|nr:GNAT family N-acetyltransferase [Plectonema radiosum]NJM17762.1 GNAT family N-acetyltransferase [Richelia sp. SM1_7_0]NJN06814.1 GNAT family N-acetyltransferase [Richelia sp. RM1_1_1]NJO26491.1 GNAT family N-acetyltransferase [Richelia sp. SL_2_1]NJO57387.1 GNAT family N-acetyltransferase [Richelia sp. RM2_1_2]MBE9212738.1 GNAT family N-acetyltransferase [Plectonema cf. radiosum LEGE 06105]
MQSENNNVVYVRELKIDDIAPVFHLGEQLFTSDLYPYLYRTWDEWEVIGLYNTDAEYCLVAEVDQELAGFILGTIISKASWTYGYILWLGVNPKFQRRRVADKLVDNLIARMIEDGARFMLADTDPANVPAVKFFHRKGFGNTRQHIFLSMNLSKHEQYGRLIEYEHQKAERAGYRRSNSIRARKQELIGGETIIKPIEKEFDEENQLS